jgi:hypothetical protein
MYFYKHSKYFNLSLPLTYKQSGNGYATTTIIIRVMMMIMIIIIIQFNSCLFTCKLNSTEANYKVTK